MEIRAVLLESEQSKWGCASSSWCNI